MQVKRQQLEPDMEQWTGSKLGKEYCQGCMSGCLFNLYAEYIMRNTGLDETQAVSSRLPGEISITSDMQMNDTTLMAETKIMCISQKNLGASFLTSNLEFCIFKISIQFCVPILLHKIWNSVYFRYESHCDTFTLLKIEFSICYV